MKCILPAWKLCVFQLSPLDVILGVWGGRSSNDKFEQVSSNHHQMSLAVGVGMSGKGGCSPYYVTCPMMHVM